MRRAQGVADRPELISPSGIIPNNVLLTYFKPRRFFPFMISVWAALTMVNAAARNPHDLMAIRFFQGYFESCIYAGSQYVLGTWYTKHELGQRTGLFTASGLAGSIFGSLLQAGIYNSMDGLHDLPGWKWLFLVGSMVLSSSIRPLADVPRWKQITGIITFPVAAYGYIFFPDTPHTTTAFYLTEEEKQLARERVPCVEHGESVMSWNFLRRLLSSWHLYAFSFLWILGNCSEEQSSQSLLNLYMQGHPERNYTVDQLNNWPTGVQGVGIVSTLLWAIGTDVWGGRWTSAYYVAVTAIGNAVMILVPSNTATKFAAYYWAGSIYCIQATLFAWANESMRDQPLALRSCVIACMNTAGNCFQAWWPLIFYRADEAPEFTVSLVSLLKIAYFHC